MAVECSLDDRCQERPTLGRILMRHRPGVYAMSLWDRWPRSCKSGSWAKRTAVLMLSAMLWQVQLPWHGAYPARVVAREAATVPGAIDPFADVVPEALVPAERAADELSAIRMEVALDPATSAIGGEMSVTWRNPASEPLSDVWFRLFPNAFYYGEGGLQVADVTAGGAPVSPELASRTPRCACPCRSRSIPGRA